MASIEKRGNSYRIVVCTGYDANGKKIRETEKFEPDERFNSLTEKQKQKELNRFAAEFESKVLNGKILQGRNLTVKQFADKWIKEYLKKRETTTYDGYVNELETKIIPALGHIKMSKLTPLHVQQFYNNLCEDGVRLDGKEGHYSYGTIKKVAAVLSSMLSTAVIWQVIESNPCERVELTDPDANENIDEDEEEENCFTLEETALFLDALDIEYKWKYKSHTRKKQGTVYKVAEYYEIKRIATQFKVFYNIAIFSGARRGEILALTWSDINFDNNTMRIIKNTVPAKKKVITKVPKNKTSKREVSLPESIMDLIKKYKVEQDEYRLSIGEQWQGDNFLFIQANGKKMHPSTPTHKFKEIIKKYNEVAREEGKKMLPENVTLHGLRHTSATLLIADKQTDIKTISKRLGHANTSTTMNIYAHAMKEMDHKAASAMENMLKRKA